MKWHQVDLFHWDFTECSTKITEIDKISLKLAQNLSKMTWHSLKIYRKVIRNCRFSRNIDLKFIKTFPKLTKNNPKLAWNWLLIAFFQIRLVYVRSLVILITKHLTEKRTLFKETVATFSPLILNRLTKLNHTPDFHLLPKTMPD